MKKSNRKQNMRWNETTQRNANELTLLRLCRYRQAEVRILRFECSASVQLQSGRCDVNVDQSELSVASDVTPNHQHAALHALYSDESSNTSSSLRLYTGCRKNLGSLIFIAFTMTYRIKQTISIK